MQAKRIIFLILALCTAMTSAGCWDAMDINDKALVSLVLTDRQNDEFVFYIEVPNLAAGQNRENVANEQFEIVSGGGTTYADARRHLNAKMDKPIFLGTARALIITDELAKYGIEEYMFRLQNMLDYRKTVSIATTRATPEELLSENPENNISIGASIEETINSLQSDGRVITFTASDVLEFLYANYCFVLLNIDLKEGRLAYTGYTIIHQGKYLGFIPMEESKGLVWLLGDEITRLYVVPVDDGFATVEVKCKKRDISPVFADGQITFNISFEFKSEIQYLSTEFILDKTAEEQVRNNLQAQLVEDISNAIRLSKSYQCDYMGFREHFRVAYPNVEKQISPSDWPAYYVNAAFSISAVSTLDVGGQMDFETQYNQ